MESRRKWSSPGGQSKRFCSSNADLVLTWHKGKQNTLTLHGKDGDLVRDKCILLCSQNNQYLLSPTLEVHEANTQSQSSVFNGIECALDESKISNITSQLSTVLPDKASQTENLIAGIYNCNCYYRVYAADLEGVKLDLLIL